MKTAQTIKIELLQGDNSPIVFSADIFSVKLNKISATLALRIVMLMQKAKKYRMDLGGFSFARKFDIRITIDEVSASGSADLAQSAVRFGIALQANEGSVERFHNFIVDLVNVILTGEGQIEIANKKELLEELQLN